MPVSSSRSSHAGDTTVHVPTPTEPLSSGDVLTHSPDTTGDVSVHSGDASVSDRAITDTSGDASVVSAGWDEDASVGHAGTSGDVPGSHADADVVVLDALQVPLPYLTECIY